LDAWVINRRHRYCYPMQQVSTLATEATFSWMILRGQVSPWNCFGYSPYRCCSECRPPLLMPGWHSWSSLGDRLEEWSWAFKGRLRFLVCHHRLDYLSFPLPLELIKLFQTLTLDPINDYKNCMNDHKVELKMLNNNIIYITHS
jgi:hypothetical protein